ncbi:hypothetical protein [Rhizobium sp. SSA_523]|uniref:hypothetical protein n=1 Tax=Rhizobium sp. SSA_523 TaxID=2952477 RepID=UPI002658F241|nr:hypothetical protein [Rhizobium sp. SSA_523]
MRHPGQGSTGGTYEPLLSNALLARLTAGLVVLALAVAAISLGGRWYGQQLTLAGHTASTEIFDIAIGNDRLRTPANIIRFPEQRRSGAAERLNLYLTWPDMQGYSLERRERFDQLSFADSLLFLEITEATMSRDMSGRLEPIYQRLFDKEPVDAGHGLMLHHLRSESGYGDEVILTGKRPGRPDYVVRCILAPAKETGGSGRETSGSGDCQRDIHMGSGLNVLYRFSSSRLGEWDHIDAAITAFVGSRLAEEEVPKI